MSRKFACLYLAVALLVSSIWVASADERDTIQQEVQYSAAVEALDAAGLTSRSSNVLPSGEGLALALELGLPEEETISLSQLPTEALKTSQAQEDAARRKQADTAAAAADAAAHDGAGQAQGDQLGGRPALLGFLGLGAVGRGGLMGHTAIGRIAIAAEVCRIGAAEGGAARAAVGGGTIGGGAFVRACVGIYRKGLAVGVGNTGAIGAAVPLTAADGTLSRLIFGGLSVLKTLALIIWEHKKHSFDRDGITDSG